VADSRGQRKGRMNSVRGGEFLDQFEDSQLLKRDSTP
jgi:hypothetical protein